MNASSLASQDQNSFFDDSGDELMRHMDESLIDPEAINGLIPFPDIIDHPNFINTKVFVYSMSLENIKVPFTAVPKAVTMDFRQRKAIIFSDISRLDNGRQMDTLVISVSEITDIYPLQETAHLFTQNVVPKPVLPSPSPETVASSESVDIPCYQQPITTNSPNTLSSPTIQRSSTMQSTRPRHLPMAKEGVDLLLLHLWYKTDCPDQTRPSFAQWREDQGFEDQMRDKGLRFHTSHILERSRYTYTSEQRRRLLKQWEDSYQQIKLGFDDWHDLFIRTSQPQSHKHRMEKKKPSAEDRNLQAFDSDEEEKENVAPRPPPRPQPLPMSIPDITQEEDTGRSLDSSPLQELSQSFEIVSESSDSSGPPMDPESSHHLPTSFMEQPLMPDDNGYDPMALLRQVSNDQLQFEHPKHWEMRMGDVTPFQDWEIKMSYDANGQNTSRFLRNVDIKPEDFLPGGRLETIYIPSYLYIPDAVFKILNLNPRLVQYCRLMLWHKLLKARQDSQAGVSAKDLQGLIGNDWMDHLARSVRNYPKKSYTNIIDLIQHTKAQGFNKEYKLPPQTVYDTLFRPLERLCGVDMPLHHTLIKARFCMQSRRNLFHKFLSIINFKTSTHDLSLDHHQFYQILSGIRHLSYANLTPHHFHATGPFMTILSLDPYEEDPREAHMSLPALHKLEEDIEYMVTRTSAVGPHISIPPSDVYLQEFPELGGINMSMKKQRLIVDIHNNALRLLNKQETRNRPQNIMAPEVLRDPELATMDDSEPRMSYAETIQLRPQRQQRVPVPVRIPTASRTSVTLNQARGISSGIKNKGPTEL